jgi:hypothetical protein
MSAEDREIAELAYRLWEARGRPADSAERDWLEAEALLAARKSNSSVSSVAGGMPKVERRKSRAPRAKAPRDPSSASE